MTDQSPSPPPSRASYLRSVLWFIAAALVVGATVRYDTQLDVLYDRYTAGNAFLDGAAVFVTLAFALPALALGALLLKMLDRRLPWRFYAEFCAVMLTQMFASIVLKQLAGRPRPMGPEAPAGDPFVFHGPNLHEWNGSFPSGHATASFALAVVMGAYYPRWRIVFYVLAAIIPFCRVQMNRHFISDIVAGAFLGWFAASWTLRYVRRRWPPRQSDPSPGPSPEPTT